MFRTELLLILPLVVAVTVGQTNGGYTYYGTSNVRDQRPQPVYGRRPLVLPPRPSPLVGPVTASPVAPTVTATPVPAEPAPVLGGTEAPAAPPAQPAPSYSPVLPSRPIYTPVYRPLLPPRPITPAPSVVAPSQPPAIAEPQQTVNLPPVTEAAPPEQPVEVITPIAAPGPAAEQPEPTPILKPEPIRQTDPVLQPKPISQPEPIRQPEPVQEPEPISLPEPVQQPEPFSQPQPISQPEPVQQPEIVSQREPVLQPEPISLPEPVQQPEPISLPEPVPQLEPVQQPESVSQPEPVQKLEPEPAPQPEPSQYIDQVVPVPEPQPGSVAAPQPISLTPVAPPLRSVIVPQHSKPVALPPLLPKPEPVRETAFGRHPQHSVKPPTYYPITLPPPTPSYSYYPTPARTVATQLPPVVVVTRTTQSVYQPPVTQAPGQFELDFQCRDEVNGGYHSIEHECDTYIECKQGRATKYACPDGLHFNPIAKHFEYPCAYPSEVKCMAGDQEQNPNPTDKCPNQYGFYSMNDGDCSRFIMCQEGLATIMNCPMGLVFNLKTSSCDWPANVPQCNPSVFKDFTCPDPPEDENGQISDIILKYRYHADCKLYIACQLGRPRLLSCERGLYFDDVSQSCINEDYVTDCAVN